MQGVRPWFSGGQALVAEQHAGALQCVAPSTPPGHRVAKAWNKDRATSCELCNYTIRAEVAFKSSVPHGTLKRTPIVQRWGP